MTIYAERPTSMYGRGARVGGWVRTVICDTYNSALERRQITTEAEATDGSNSSRYYTLLNLAVTLLVAPIIMKGNLF